MRYLKVTLLIGFSVALFVAGPYETGLLHRLETVLAIAIGRNAPPALHSDRPLQYALFATLALGIAWTTIDISRFTLKLAVFATAVAQVVTAAWVLGLYGIRFSPLGSVAAMLLSFIGALLYARSEGGRRKRVVRDMFGERVSQGTFLALVDLEAPLNFDGEKCEATVVVCEIFNHEELASVLPVPDYVAMNNAFLRNAADFLVERGGYLDECDGESLRVIFGTPLPDPQHAVAACKAALALTERLDAVNAECRQIWKETFDFRVGVNSGEMVVAAYGSRRLGNFSVAGEAVEFARRLCAANTIYGSRILMGAATFAEAETAVEVRPMELIQRHPHDRSREEVYELLALRNALSGEEVERRDLFWKGIVYYRKQLFDEALGLFQSARAVQGNDGPVEFYIRRIEQLRAGLPALDWHSGRF